MTLDVELGRLRRRGGARRGQGRQDADRAGRRARAARRSTRYLRARPPGARADAERSRRAALFLSKSGRRLGTSDVRRRLRIWARRRAGRRRWPTRTRTRCGTRSPPTCSRAAPTCARSRSCSATRAISTTQVYTRVESSAAEAAYAQRSSASVGTIRGDSLETNVKAVELHELWRRYKTSGDQRARERLVVAYSPLVKYVAGRMGVGPAGARRGGRPDLLRPGRPDLRDRALRPRAARSSSRPTRSRASGARSSTSCARSTGCRARCAPAPARSSARTSSSRRGCSARRPTRRWRPSSRCTIEEFHEALLQISNSSIVALDELWSASDAGGDQVSLLDTLPDRGAPDPAAGSSTRPSCATGSPTRSRRCPSARSS